MGQSPNKLGIPLVLPVIDAVSGRHVSPSMGGGWLCLSLGRRSAFGTAIARKRKEKCPHLEDGNVFVSS